MAAVEKLAGKIKTNTKKTGTHRGKIDSLNVMSLSCIFDIYLAT